MQGQSSECSQTQARAPPSVEQSNRNRRTFRDSDHRGEHHRQDAAALECLIFPSPRIKVRDLFPSPEGRGVQGRALTALRYFDTYQNMKKEKAIAALAALAQESRLDVFRMLVQSGPDGMPAGEIGAKLGVPSPTLSFHLNHLKHAGLVLVPARQPLDHLQRRLQGDERSDLLHDGKLLPRQCGTVRTGSLQARARRPTSNNDSATRRPKRGKVNA